MSRPEKKSPTVLSGLGLNPALERNIDMLLERRDRQQRSASLETKIAGAISKFAGSMVFVYLHIAFFGGWILVNTGLVPIFPAWDDSLVILAMIASVEAIFLSTFVLINQNRMAAEDNTRADLDLQISLLNEHETTKLITLVEAIAKRLEVRSDADAEIAELKRDVAPEEVLDRIEEADQEAEEEEAERPPA